MLLASTPSDLADGLTAVDILLGRFEAMHVAYRMSPRVDGCIEGRLGDIVALQLDLLGLPQRLAPSWIDQEISLEIRSLRANDAICRLAQRAHEDGTKVVLVSDMYLSGDHIETICRSVIGDIGWISKIYSSADTTLNKRTGTVFPLVVRDNRVDPINCLHIGDNLLSDYQQPKWKAWRALHIPISSREIQSRKACMQILVSKMASEGVPISKWASI